MTVLFFYDSIEQDSIDCDSDEEWEDDEDNEDDESLDQESEEENDNNDNDKVNEEESNTNTNTLDHDNIFDLGKLNGKSLFNFDKEKLFNCLNNILQQMSKIDDKDKLLTILEELVNATDYERIFPPLDGTAFYSYICKINHSCDPNVRVNYIMDSNKGLVAQLVALKDIQAGEELVQSYIDQNQSNIYNNNSYYILFCLIIQYFKKLFILIDYSTRQKNLQDYGFKCACNKCIEESN